jgi:hypothetical protein
MFGLLKVSVSTMAVRTDVELLISIGNRHLAGGVAFIVDPVCREAHRAGNCDI